MMLAKSLQSAAGNAAGEANYIESVFQTHLYTGNGSTQTITNGIDLAGEGGLVWCKDRTTADGHRLFNTAVGSSYWLSSNTTSGNTFETTALTSFNSNGFTLGSSSTANFNTDQYASWTFRKQPKFFDVVTWNGNSVSGRQIPHSLGSVPGCIIVKVTSVSGSWFVWHRSMGGNNFYMTLNSPDPRTNGGAPYWNNTGPTDTVFTVGNDSDINQTGRSYVAYLFAHDAGGFGLSGTDNVISCGSYTGNGSNDGPVVTLGYEPQWVLIKKATGGSADWQLQDNMRGMNLTSSVTLFPNTSAAESSFAWSTGSVRPLATGFSLGINGSNINENGQTYIYIAIRRGPMKVPESGTEVFTPVLRTGNGVNTTITSGHVTDLIIPRGTNNAGSNDYITTAFLDRLRGTLKYLKTNNTGDAAEASGTNTITSFANMTGVNVGSDSVGFCNIDTVGYVNWLFRRAPSFFDEICYTGTGSAQTFAHNLGIAPELIFVKTRSNTRDWAVYSAPLGATKYLNLNNSSVGGTSSTYWNDTAPTSSVFTANTALEVNNSGWTYVAYLFATCPGVSKVGNYTGTGALQTINCGFSSGARFVLIKRTDASGGWYVWDSARGISSGNDPYVVTNTNTVQVTSTNYVDTTSVGFQVTAAAPADINASGGTYIFLAIA